MQAIEAEEIAALERANYLALQPWVQAVPGATMVVRDDVVLTWANLFPTPDFNHACLLRATPAGVEPTVDEIVAHYKRRWRRVHIFVSPACTPADIGERLLARGFEKQPGEEPWLRCDLRGWLPPPVGSDAVRVVKVGPRDARIFARVYLASFGMTAALAPLLAPLLKRLMRVPSTRYGLALLDGQPAGVCVWHTHGDIAALGGMGVLPHFRGSRVATTLGMQVMLDAQAEGKKAIVAQMIHGGFEEFVSQYGFKRVFTRIHYVLSG
jgi:N-acetylglutamate synthase-like GNAT family acetyltransferase